jgi:hypothetical protein
MSGQIFISYRRDDSSAWAGRLSDHLVTNFPRSQVFMDVGNLDPGVDFVEAIETSVSRCEVLIAVIGKRWLVDEEGKHRLDNRDDFVRLEIATALKRNISVIPVLVDGALMPRSTEIPDDLKPLVRRNALEVSHDRFLFDSGRLTNTIKRFFEKAEGEQRQREEQDRLGVEQHRQSPKAGEEKALSATVPPIPPPSQDGGSAQAETPPTIQSKGSTKQKPSAQVASLVVFALIWIVGLIWFVGSKLNYGGRESVLVTPTPTPTPERVMASRGSVPSVPLSTTRLPNPKGKLDINQPQDGNQVIWRLDISGSGATTEDTVWLIVHPMETGAYWVQSPISPRKDGTWRVQAYIGRGVNLDVGKRFELMSVANPVVPLRQGLVLDQWPEAEARSNVIAVIRK